MGSKVFLLLKPRRILKLRLVRGKDDRKQSQRYLERAKQAIVWEAAANAWSQGVPWTEALELADRAISKAEPKARAIPKNKAAAKKAAAKKAAAKKAAAKGQARGWTLLE